MFDSLRKKLKDAVSKVTKSVREEKQEPAEAEVAKIEKKKEELKELKDEFDLEKAADEISKEVTEKALENKFEEVEKKDVQIKKSDAQYIDEKLRDEQQDAKQEIEEQIRTKEDELRKEITEFEEGKLRTEIEEKKVREAKLAAEPKRLEEPAVKPLIEKKGLFSKFLEKTITEEDVQKVIKELQFALLENDVAVDVAEKICNDVKADLVSKSVKRGKISEAIEDALKKSMLGVMSQKKISIENLIDEKEGVFTIMFLGFNGTGKTTTLAKLAYKLKKFNPVVAAGDTFRAASIEQLEEHSRRLGFRLVRHQYGSDSAAVLYDARKAALAAGSKLVLADTAGRSHSNVNLMDELKKVVRVNQPDLKILILDSLTGNDIYEQSRLFNEAVGVDAIILTKADVYDKGGAALSATYTLKKPILFLGVGQEYKDLKEFNPEEIVEGLLK